MSTRVKKAPVGSYKRNLADGDSTLKWNCLAEMQFWMRNEERTHTIQFFMKEPRYSKNKKDHYWLVKHIYVCVCQKSMYVPKHDRTRDIPAWRAEAGYPCRLTVKTYPDTTMVLGRYAHSHPVGDDNVLYTCIPVHIRAKLKSSCKKGCSLILL
ncbi:hypothetical protein B0H19DRAFT_1263077 [Mycena capillaripes]|nr:hypothetical protein B0H19DRAFT_1263077 [Mycena capillaripes]